MFNFGKIFNYYNNILGNFFYKNDNIFTYNFFSKNLIKRLLKKNNNIDENIKNFFLEGILDGPKIKTSDCNIILDNLNENDGYYNKDKTQFFFYINDTLKNHLKKIINKYFEKDFSKISKFFNSNIYLCQTVISKIYSFEKVCPKNESFSENFHNDRWLSNHFKVFVLLEDVNHENGPTIFIKKNETRKFGAKMNYKSRSNYNFFENYENQISNCGLKGETKFVDTTQVLHRASVPIKNRTRLMMIFSFAMLPNFEKDIFYFENDKLGSIWDAQNYKPINYLAKPIGLKKLFKIYNGILNL